MSRVTAMSAEGRAWLKALEGCSLDAYRDTVGVWTIGYGNTSWPNGKPVREGEKLADRYQANRLFDRALAPRERLLVSWLRRDDLEQHQFDALCSWLWNTGGGKGRESGLLVAVNARAGLDVIAKRFREWRRPAEIWGRREAEVLAYTRGLYVDQGEAMRRVKEL